MNRFNVPVEHREIVTHYFYDARLSLPSPIRGYAKTEEGARRACVVRIDAEQFNKAVVLRRETGEVLQVYRRDPETGAINRQDHRYMRWLGQKMWGALA